MKRREFLRYTTLGGLALSGSGLLVYALAGRHSQTLPAALLDNASIPAGQPLQPLPRIVNLSDQVGRFHSVLTPAAHAVPVSDGLEATLWLYNGKVAPLIEVREGDELDIILMNELDQDTTLHWHGVPVPQAQDGAPWDAVASGETRHYRYILHRGSAGLHWFHPHPHEGTARQVAHGLAGALLVRPRLDVLPVEVEEHLLVVSDLRLTTEGEVASHTAEDWMNGREGELLLVNGQRAPRLDVAPGATLRLRLINACAGRYLRLRLEDHELTLIGTDGGLIERPQPLKELLITPGERTDLLVRVSEKPERSFELASHPYTRGWMGAKPTHLDEIAPLLSIHTLNAGVSPAVKLPNLLSHIEPLGEPAVRRQVELAEVMPDHGDHGAVNDTPHAGHGGSDSHHGSHGRGHGESHPGDEDRAVRPKVDFLINGRAFAMNDVLFEGQVGEVEEWDIFNNSHMDHPFHVHGTHFQVIATRDADSEWQDAPWLAWKDTVNLAPYQRLRLRMVFIEPGDWLFHCHIIEHEELGMMATIRIS